MGIPGFPSEKDLASMFGYVTDEDREKWAQQKAASDAQLERSRNGLTARELAAQAAVPAMSFAEQAVNAELHAARTEAARNTMQKEKRRTRTTTTTEFIKDEPLSDDEYEAGVGF